MDKFHDGQYVWLRSRVHGTYLTADRDGKGVSLHRRRGALKAAWVVHIHQGDTPAPYLLLYNAANGRYLAATATRAPPGHIGFRAEQRDYDQPELQAIMWRAAGTGFRNDVLLRSVGGRYLRANGKYTGKYLRLKNVTVDDINNVSTMMYWTVKPIPLREPNMPMGLAHPSLGRRPRELSVSDMLGRERGVRRLIRFVRASPEGAFTEDGWSEFHFRGISVYQLRNEVYNRIGPHRNPHPDILPHDIVMCVRAGRYGRLIPLIVNLPCNGDTLQIVLCMSRTPAYGRLRYPDVHAE